MSGPPHAHAHAQSPSSSCPSASSPSSSAPLQPSTSSSSSATSSTLQTSLVLGPGGAWLRAHLYKLLFLLVGALLLLQYAFSSSLFEPRQLEPLFAINASTGLRAAALSGGGFAPAEGAARPSGWAARHRGLVLDSPLPPQPPSAHAAANATATSSSDSLQPDAASASASGAALQASPSSPASSAPLAPSSSSSVVTSSLPLCPPVPPNLVGPLHVIKESAPLIELESRFPELQKGGVWRPTSCRARHRVALVVPYRDRAAHLSIFLQNLHPMLQRQQLDYRIVVVEQAGLGPFNRAMLMNVGFVEALKLYDFDCFIFHDVDLLPEDDRNLYNCPEQPRHMSVAIDVFRYRLPYAGLFGGVSAMTKEQFRKVNGFSNMFWGWGGEDDDMSNRIKYYGYHISRYPANVARYKMLTHRKQRANPKRYEFLNTGHKRFKSDGLNSLRYVRRELRLHHSFTRVLVELASPS